ncbi:uncharacterized protein MYCFIDRAFT_169220 [Pseudocercospora fijiensis CIRAD86]|uniref:Uncharacterized protein n=1 Tax=Pseudocercospora fijiensis (strain CIRAD86) TaxID=383855 RepID=N1Q764_PSEFD|nr:uncharacterized protein MYCFIDRAFT_169220 [Pseudocercospora fijiensis CIRAD86]EME87381.1 hypothetical protein MYCFIDRAFT_169220 [Pseudocercospora fijiensis CIRAD86]
MWGVSTIPQMTSINRAKADKIPDPWFEKIPGGFYKAKEQQQRIRKSLDMKKHRSRRHSDDEYDDEHSRPDRDDGYRSEGHGRRSTLGKSYDGGDDYDSINNRPRRSRSKPRRYRDDDDRYGHEDAYSRRDRRDGANGVEYGTGVVPPEQQLPQAHPIPPGVDPYVAGAAAAAGAAGVQAAQAAPFSPVSDPRSPQPPPSLSNHSGGTNPFVRSTSTLRGGMATGYVPYAHIYGGPKQANDSPNFAPPPSDTASVQPNSLNQVAAPVAQQQGYVQNPYAQEAPPGSQPAYMPDPYWNERQYQKNQHREHNGRRDRPRRDDYESSEDSYSPPRSRRSRRSRRDRSYSRDRYSDDSHRSRRAPSERPPKGNAGPPARGKSQMKGPFDTSSKGLGSSVVGAIAGGLVGSELGKDSKIPGAVGSILGPPTVRQPHPQPPPVFVDPHKSLAPQMAYPSSSPPPPPPPHSRLASCSWDEGRSTIACQEWLQLELAGKACDTHSEQPLLDTSSTTIQSPNTFDAGMQAAFMPIIFSQQH